MGFRVHSGWAALVTVAGRPESPKVLQRRRIQIADRGIPGSSQPFHHAKELGIGEAQAYLDECKDLSRGLASAALKKAIGDLRDHQVFACSVLLSSGRVTAGLEATLASHAAIHTAEGNFFRDSIVSAVEASKLRCEKIKEKALLETAAAAFHIDDLDARMRALGKLIGPPWRQDEKFAALAAWLVLRV